MKWLLGLVITGWTMTAALAAPQSAGNVIVAHGALTLSNQAGSDWLLKVSDALKVRGENISEVSFATRPGPETAEFAAFAGRDVELTGEVKSVADGKAGLREVRAIGAIATGVGALNPPALAKRCEASGDAGATSPSVVRVPYRHAYYLFPASAPVGCEPCYIPLLITRDTLQEVAKQPDALLGVFIITYERDSVWQFRGAALVTPSGIEVPTRTIRVNGRSYRYQEIALGEVVNLLEHPMGTIPISRPMMVQKSVPGASPAELIADFRILMRNDKGRP